ncbi:MAG: cation transporter, partial [Methylibium sp.]|nr:cation transporter [Methylibium sp.]
MTHSHDLSPWQHRHDFSADRGKAERRTHWVIAITLVMMVAEITAGWAWNSMALLADGWHMGTHAAAIGVA